MSDTKNITVELNNVKIMLIGLDNSGKTSITLSLGRTTNLLSYCTLKPTPGLDVVKIEDEKTRFSIWDFGGQEKYRQAYLEDPKQFEKVDKIIFVIDVQDIDRYDLALDYLKAVIEIIKKHEIKGGFSIFLHKFDPGLENLENFTNEAIKTNLVEKIKKIMSTNLPYKVFKTTIYTVFQKQLLI